MYIYIYFYDREQAASYGNRKYELHSRQKRLFFWTMELNEKRGCYDVSGGSLCTGEHFSPVYNTRSSRVHSKHSPLLYLYSMPPSNSFSFILHTLLIGWLVCHTHPTSHICRESDDASSILVRLHTCAFVYVVLELRPKEPRRNT